MPKLVDRNPESAPGDRYIDTHCIDCAASREIAPGLVMRPHGKSIQQPKPSGRVVIPAGLPEAELKITEILPVRFSALEGSKRALRPAAGENGGSRHPAPRSRSEARMQTAGMPPAVAG